MDKPTWKPHDGYSGTDIHDDYGEAWKYIEHLEGLLGAGNLCAFQMPMRHGCDSDVEMRSIEPRYDSFSAIVDGTERDFGECLPVLIADEDGIAVWRFYRKAGH